MILQTSSNTLESRNVLPHKCFQLKIGRKVRILNRGGINKILMNKKRKAARVSELFLAIYKLTDLKFQLSVTKLHHFLAES